MTLSLPLARPPWGKLGKKMESSFRKALFDFKLLEDDPIVTVALSGGKDSLTLLHLLHAVSGRGFPKIDIHAVHVSGAFSCGAGVDKGYLSNLCRELGVNLMIRESKQTLEDLECYSCSRERRRLLFEAAESVGSRTIAFGHHRDDSVQTALMNLMVKGEFAGMLPKLPFKKFGMTLIRPLIYINEEDIRNFAKAQGFARIMCRCPVGQNSLRKKVDRLLDEMEEMQPGSRSNLAHAILKYGSDKALHV